jgi:hypothetical protein
VVHGLGWQNTDAEFCFDRADKTLELLLGRFRPDPPDGARDPLGNRRTVP